jgi:hypothetical protein
MQQPQARQILETLAEGLDPVTGSVLESGSVCRQPEVVTALLEGISALDEQALRTRRRALLPQNLGRPWRKEEEQRLEEAFRGGLDLSRIATEHRRTLAAIEARLERLGLLTPEQRVTRNRYVSRPSA